MTEKVVITKGLLKLTFGYGKIDGLLYGFGLRGDRYGVVGFLGRVRA